MIVSDEGRNKGNRSPASMRRLSEDAPPDKRQRFIKLFAKRDLNLPQSSGPSWLNATPVKKTLLSGGWISVFQSQPNVQKPPESSHRSPRPPSPRHQQNQGAQSARQQEGGGSSEKCDPQTSVTGVFVFTFVQLFSTYCDNNFIMGQHSDLCMSYAGW